MRYFNIIDTTAIAKISMIIIAAIILLAALFPTVAYALGVEGFDLSRPDSKYPDSPFHFNAKSGESIEDRIMLANTSDSPQKLRLYAADGISTSNGSVTLKERLDKKTGLAKWITMDSPEMIKLEAGEKRIITFRIKVPVFSKRNEKLAGIVVEQASAIKGKSENEQFVINVLPRAAILITQRLPGPAIEKLSIVKFTRAWSKRKIVFNLAIKNFGNVHLRPTMKINIYNMFGQKIDTMNLGKLATIFPKTTSRIPQRWDKTPIIGYFTADAIMKYGKNKSDRRQITMLIFPWWVLPILLALWLIARQQRKRRAARRAAKLEKEQATAAEAVTAAVKEAVSEIEKKMAASTKGTEAGSKTKKKPAVKKTKSVPKKAASTKKATKKTATAAKKPATKKTKSEKVKTASTKKKATKKPAAAKKKVTKKTTTGAKKPAARKSTTKKTD